MLPCITLSFTQLSPTFAKPLPPLMLRMGPNSPFTTSAAVNCCNAIGLIAEPAGTCGVTFVIAPRSSVSSASVSPTKGRSTLPVSSSSFAGCELSNLVVISGLVASNLIDSYTMSSFAVPSALASRTLSASPSVCFTVCAMAPASPACWLLVMFRSIVNRV